MPWWVSLLARAVWNQGFQEFQMKIQVSFSVFKTSKLAVKMNLVSHNGIESCFLEKFLTIQVLFSVWWTFKASFLKWTLYHICHNGMETCFLEEFLIIQVLFSVSWTFKASFFEINIVSHMSQWYGIMFSWRISNNSSHVFCLINRQKQTVLKWTLYHTCHNGMESCFL